MYLLSLFKLGVSAICCSCLGHFVLWAQSPLDSTANATNSEPAVFFKVQLLNAESEFSAAGLIDVNSDGRLDIVCGAWWYESPSWTKHYFREVEKIRGRYDDYSNLVVDIDGDSLKDIVSVNYRSQSLYWVRNPGRNANANESSKESPSLWDTKIIDRPGTSETGRLVDIDGDGQLDVLPSGTNFAAWYEFKRAGSEVTWLKHQLPDELIGHGVGTGDLNGDGRLDVVSPNGWAEAPTDPRNDRWIWHGEFQLARDCGLPILCWDVDQDGDTDLVWGRGHNIGLYWTERVDAQQSSLTIASESVPADHPALEAIRNKKWITHAIDTSWSGIHTLMTADIDGDDREELVAGKRYMAHDGKDPGEYDPLAIYWYSFDKQQKTWKRHTASVGRTCGIDLDSACADLDGDGDIDIVAPTRAGLHWLENLRINPGDKASANNPARSASLKYDEHQDLSYLLDSQGNRQAIETPFHHGIRRQHILAQMQQVMGELPSSQARIPLETEVQSIEKVENYWRIHLTFATDRHGDKIDRVPAFLLVPQEFTKPAPAMLCLHQTHFELGKGEPCGLGGSANLHIAHELAQRGFVCLAPDYPGFAEYAYSFEENAQLYASGTMKGIWNHIRAIDLLETLPCVKRDSIGVMGHSLGGHNSLFVAAFDQRLRCVVTSCGFNAFADYYGGDLKGWTSARYMPRIATEYGSSPKQMPFDFPEVLAAIAPRPTYVNAPRGDANFAVVGVEKCEKAVRPLYADLFKIGDRLVFEYPDAAHDFPTEVRQRVYDWLKVVLK